MLSAMPVRMLVHDIAVGKGYRNARELADAAGISYSSMYAIWDGEVAYLHMTTLGKLCKALETQPGMLLIYEAESQPTRHAASPESVRAKRRKPRPPAQK
jgi:DNA-binding Xre family transcriptional regulator